MKGKVIMNKRNGNEKYFYEIRLSEDLMREARYFAEEQNTELDLYIEEILKEGLKTCKALEKSNVKQLKLNFKY